MTCSHSGEEAEMRYSTNLAERMHQIAVQIPKRSFPRGILPGYVPFMTDEETDEWVNEQWDGYKGTQKRHYLAPYVPRIIEVADEQVAEALERVSGLDAFVLRSVRGRNVTIVRVGKHMWSATFPGSHGAPDIFYGLAAAMRAAMELGYDSGVRDLAGEAW